MRRIAAAATAGAALTLAAALTAGATSGPVGPLPAGQVTTVVAPHGSLVSVVLPKAAHGRSWRQARPIDPSVLRQISEADVGPNVVVVFKAIHAGSVRAVYAQTRGETPKAYASVTYRVTVR